MTELSSNALEVCNKRYFEEGEGWEQCTERVARVVAQHEKDYKKHEADFQNILYNKLFLPGGRILRNAGREKGSLFNCFHLPISDSIEGIGQFYKDALTLWSEGGGVGCNFSSLRPKDDPIIGKGGNSSGLVSFLIAGDHLSETIKSGGGRRAAGICHVDVSHPEIIDFINAKLTDKKIANFNISVMVTDEFILAVERDADWDLKFKQKVYRTIKARELWDLIIRNMIRNGEPGLINWTNFRKNNSFFTSPVTGCNPCGEAHMSPHESCDLGSVVLPNFITGTINTNWKLLEETINTSVRFLDNIFDISKYAIKANEIKSNELRRIGLGVMGLADYFFYKKIRYGSDKALYETERLMKFVRDVAYAASIRLASEKGAFPAFEPIDYAKASFVRKMPAATRADIKKYGMRNVTTSSIAPNGCLVDGTLVSSSIGVLHIEDYYKYNEDSESRVLKTKSDFGDVFISKYFDQGTTCLTKTVKTRHGYELRGTIDHKIRIISEGGGYSWKRLEKIKKGDLVVLKKDFLTKKYQSWLSDYRAELIGYYMADGWWTVNDPSHRLYFETKDEREFRYVSKLLKNGFGNSFFFKIRRRDRENTKSIRIEVNSKKLYKWFEKFGCVKNYSINAFIPKIVLSGSTDNILSFLKGYHTGDGHITIREGRVGFTTISKVLATQLQTILLGIGIISHTNKEVIDKDIFICGRKVISRSPAYRIQIGVQDSLKFISKVIDREEYEEYEDNNPIPLTPDEVTTLSYGSVSHTSKTFKSSIDIPYLTKQTYLSKFSGNWFSKNNLILDVVDDVYNSTEKIHINDLEVHNTSHTYIANGFITHNSISMIPECVGGIEPLAAKAYTRHDEVGNRLYIHPLYKSLLEANGEAPEWFVDSQDLTPEDHLKIQAAVQKYVDGGVSKTILLPKEISTDQLSDILINYLPDLKGVTVYVDGSREGQPINKMSEEEVLSKMSEDIEEEFVDETITCASGQCDL